MKMNGRGLRHFLKNKINNKQDYLILFEILINFTSLNMFFNLFIKIVFFSLKIEK